MKSTTLKTSTPLRVLLYFLLRGLSRFRGSGWTTSALAPLAVALAACGGGSSSGGAPGASAYPVSGSIAHLSAPGLVLNDGNQSLRVSANATSFAFPSPVGTGSNFNVTVATQPANENCVVNNGSGTVSDAAVTDISIACNTVIAQPVAVGVYPVGSATSADSRVFLPIAMVGNNTVSINAILDTGSAGVVLNAFDVFPSSMVTSSGFAFPPGQTSITYNGITVTNVSATRSYGRQGVNSTEDLGNIGFAQISVGTQGNITTAVIPILFVYQFQRNGVSTAIGQLANLIGINPDIGQVIVGGSNQTARASTSTAVCTPQSTTSCGQVSPLRSLGYAQGIDAGYTLEQFSLVNCSIDTAGDCPAGNYLMLGLDSSVTGGFAPTALSSCQTVSVPKAGNQPICSQVIPEVTIASGSSSFIGPAIFDSGAPAARISVPTGDSFPATLPTGTTVDLTTPTNISWQFQTGTGPTAVDVVQNAEVGSYSNTGIAFFTQHSLQVDYTNQTEGWN